MTDPATIAAGMKTASIIAAGKKMTIGVLAMASSELKDATNMTHLIVGTVVGLISGTIILTAYGQDIKYAAGSANKLSQENQSRIEVISSDHAAHVLTIEKRLGPIEAGVKITKYQNMEILRILQRNEDARNNK